jgi:hypothetical protein
MMVVVVTNVTRKNMVMDTCNINPFIIVYIAWERNLAIGILDGSCTSQEINPSTVL